jgi:hypothetical protein
MLLSKKSSPKGKSAKTAKKKESKPKKKQDEKKTSPSRERTCPDTKKLLKAVNREGLPLELETYKTLWSDEWAVALQSQYVDPKTEEYRTVDIVAEKSDKIRSEVYPKFEFHLDIECKKQGNAIWVFHLWKKKAVNWSKKTQAREYSKYSRYSMIDDPNQDILELIGRCSHQSPDAYPRRAILGMIIPIDSNGKRTKAKDLLLDASHKATKHLQFWHDRIIRITRNRLESSFGNTATTFWRRYPVIVFDGCMYEIELKKGEIQLKDTNYVQYEFRSGIKSYLIDIVKTEAFSDYLVEVNNEIESLKKVVEGIIWKK